MILFIGGKNYLNYQTINELSLWLDHCNPDTAFKYIALKVFTTLTCLLLQKPSRNSKAKDNIKKREG